MREENAEIWFQPYSERRPHSRGGKTQREEIKIKHEREHDRDVIWGRKYKDKCSGCVLAKARGLLLFICRAVHCLLFTFSGLQQSNVHTVVICSEGDTVKANFTIILHWLR